MGIEDKIKEFTKLSFEDKKSKLLKMLEILKWSDSLFDDIYLVITNIDVSEDLLVSVYSSIINAIENINKENLQKDVDSMKKIKNKLENIKKMEEEEKKNEDPEALLANL